MAPSPLAASLGPFLAFPCKSMPTCVAVLNASHLQDLLGCARSHNTGTTRGGDQADSDGTALASNLGGDSVNLRNSEGQQE